jgi:hypothetical protein
MANVGDLKQSRFLTQKEVDPAVLVTIRSYEQVNVAMEGADPEYRYTLTFNELEKPMTLNSTNGQIIAAIFGSEEFDDWIGEKIVLYRDPNVSFGGKLVGGIRCRAPRNQPTQDPTQKPIREPLQNEAQKALGVANPDYVGDSPEPPPEDNIPF